MVFVFLIFENAALCGSYMKGTSGSITSPGYPDFYADNQVCEWDIAGKEVSVYYSYFQLTLPQIL